jgi:hypothetical protein
MDYFVTLDRQQQSNLFYDIQQKALLLRNDFKNWYKKTGIWLANTIDSYLFGRSRGTRGVIKATLILLGISTVLGLLLILSFSKRFRQFSSARAAWLFRFASLPLLRWRLRKHATDRKSAILFFENMSSLLARYGHRRPPGQTPLEFAFTTGYDEAREITNIYNRVRFGSSGMSNDDVLTVITLLEKLRQALRNNKNRKDRERG